MTEPSAAPMADSDALPSRRQVTLLFSGLLIAMLAASLDQTIFATALPTIVGELDGVEHLAWVTTAYILAATIVMPVYGKLGDLMGRKGLYLVAIAFFVAGSIVGGLADSMGWLIAGRAVQGLGGGGLIILAQAIIADVVPARDRGRYNGAIGAVFAVSSIAGPLLGGWFADGIGWRWAFWINIPLGLIAMAAAVLFIPRSTTKPSGGRLDVVGMILLAVTTTSIVLLSVWAGTEYDWWSPQIIGLALLAIVGATLFVLVERRAAEPVMPLLLFRSRDFVLATVAGLLLGIAMFGTIGYMPTYLQMVAGVNATEAGLLLIPMMFGVMVASIGSGAAVSRTGRYKALPIVGSVITALGLLLLSTLTPDTLIWVTCGYLLVLGIGLGLCAQLLVLVVQNSFAHAIVGTATAANNFFREIGASLGSAIVGSVFASRLVASLRDGLSEDVVGGDASVSLTPQFVATLPDPVREIVVAAYNDALTPIFLWLVPLACVSAILLAFLSGKPLATRVE